ncbi:MAG: WecB/TagA/CpsF family glycosyltransferase [Gammaproteobacteria bacterium]|nr:WecB/TagA/CpsF family glycosyltransferase [Gammaproteobacteria bacterium]
MNDTSPKQLNFAGVQMTSGVFPGAADWIVDHAKRDDRTTIIGHMNVHNYYLARHDESTLAALNRHYELVFDGIGMKIGAALLGEGWLHDLNGTDLVPLVLERLAHTQLSVFLLGGSEEVSRQAAARCRRDFPGLKIAGWHHGYFTQSEQQAIAVRIRNSRARVLIVALGSGMHASFLLRYRDQFGVSLVWNAGGLFDFLSGSKPRAPALLRRARLEWLFRMLFEPRRMAHRNLVEVPWFAGHILRHRISGNLDLSGHSTKK